MCHAQPETDPAAVTATQIIADCDAKLTRYRAALEAGTDPGLVASWIAQVQARRAAALGTAHAKSGARRMTETEIRDLVAALGDLRTVLHQAHPDDKPRSSANSG